VAPWDQFVRRLELAAVDLGRAAFFFGSASECDGPSRTRRASRRIENVGCRRQSAAAHLFRGNVVRRALDSLLDSADGARLAEVDDLHGHRIVHEDVIRLDVGVDKPEFVHRLETLRHLHEYLDQPCQRGRALGIQRGAVEHFHQQVEFGNLDELAALDEAKRFAQAGWSNCEEIENSCSACSRKRSSSAERRMTRLRA